MFEFLVVLQNKYQLLQLKNKSNCVYSTYLASYFNDNKNISIAGMPINIIKNGFICLIQKYMINVYLSNYE